jgi:Fe-S-cluster containining protein
MRQTKPEDAFSAADALAFLATPSPATPPRTAAVPLVPPSPPREVAPPPPPENAYAEADKASYRHLETAAYYRALDAARSAKPGERLAAMAQAVHRLADEVWANVRGDVERAAGKRPQIACAAGCSACCSQQVAVAPVEAAAIAQYVTRHFTDEEDTALVARLRALDTLTRGKTALERAHMREPCAFLVENRCSIYPVRPLRCRAVYSRDAGYCGWAAAHPDEAAAERRSRDGAGPCVVAPVKIMDAALVGLARACRTLGIDAESVELTAAARIALAVPGLEEFVANGEPVFAAAALPGTAIEIALDLPPADDTGTP